MAETKGENAPDTVGAAPHESLPKFLHVCLQEYAEEFVVSLLALP